MSENHRMKKPIAAAALAGLLASVGVAAPSQASVESVGDRLAALRGASQQTVSGNHMNQAVEKRDSHQNQKDIWFLQFLQFLQFGQIIIIRPVGGLET